MARANEEPATARFRVDEAVPHLSTERVREQALTRLNTVSAISEAMTDDLARANASLFALDNASMAKSNDAATTMDFFKRLVAAEVKTQVATEVKTQVAAEVKTQVAAEIKTQVAVQVAALLKTQVADQGAEQVAETCAECRAKTPVPVAAKVTRLLAANGSSASSAAAAPAASQQPPAPKRTGTEAKHDPCKRQRN